MPETPEDIQTVIDCSDPIPLPIEPPQVQAVPLTLTTSPVKDPVNPGEEITCAVIDADKVYQGMVTLTRKELSSLHLTEIQECDLPAGKYWWDEKASCFWPIRPPEPEKALTPNGIKAIFEGFKAIQASGLIDLPKETKRWMNWYERSIDNRDSAFVGG